MIDDVDCGAVDGMKISRGNRSTRRKPSPVPLCPPQIPHNLTWAAAVGSRRLTALAMARPISWVSEQLSASRTRLHGGKWLLTYACSVWLLSEAVHVLVSALGNTTQTNRLRNRKTGNGCGKPWKWSCAYSGVSRAGADLLSSASHDSSLLTEYIRVAWPQPPLPASLHCVQLKPENKSVL
jgi:hypothetical protein